MTIETEKKARLVTKQFNADEVRAAAERADIRPSSLNLVLAHMAGTPYEDLAQANNMPLGTVRSRLHRAKARLALAIEAAKAEQVARQVSGD